MKNIESTIERKNIINIQEIQKTLTPSTPDDSLAAMLIQKQNSTFIFSLEQQLRELGSICDGGMDDSCEGDKIDEHLTDKELSEQLFPVLKNSQVLMDSLLCKRDKAGKIKSLSISYYDINLIKQ